jgi:Fungal N-terminal domain of STAND proteins
MEVLGTVAGVIAVAQAGDRVIQLLSRIRLYFNALQEIDALILDVTDLRMVLSMMESAASNLPRSYLIGLGKVLNRCSQIVLELEKTLNEFHKERLESNVAARTQMNRIRWLKKRNKVERLKEQLRDAKSTLTLQMLIINR